MQTLNISSFCVFLFRKQWRSRNPDDAEDSDEEEDHNGGVSRQMMMRRMKLRVNRSQLLSLSKEETSGSFQKEGTLQVGRQEAGKRFWSVLFSFIITCIRLMELIFIFFSFVLFFIYLTSLSLECIALLCRPSLSSLLFFSRLFVLMFMLLVIFCSILFSFIFCLSSSFSYFFFLIIVFIFLLVLFFDL